MNAAVVIQKLKSIGYQICTDGQDILLTADRDPDPDLATILLEDLKKCKAEAVNILKIIDTDTFITTERSQPPVAVKAVWPPEVESLVNWFFTMRQPVEPFYLAPHIYVADPVKFFASMRQVIQTGPEGPRARTGALYDDLRKLKRYLH